MAGRGIKIAKSNSLLSGEVNRPQCPIHSVSLRYLPEDLVWACTYSGCKTKVYPEVSNYGGLPIVGKGDITLLVIRRGRDKEVYLRADNNVMLRITDLYMGANRDEPSQVIVMSVDNVIEQELT
jgi:hypothetical protein